MASRIPGRHERLRSRLLVLCVLAAAAIGAGLAAGQMPNVSAQATSELCESEKYSGIRHCSIGDIHILHFDPTDPYVRFETVMAGVTDSAGNHRECRDVNLPQWSTGPGCIDGAGKYPAEYVTSMADRLKPVAAFNADLFSYPDYTHGPEGLTVKNGDRFDGWKVGDCDGKPIPVGGPCYANDTRRSSLAISRHNKLAIGPKSIADLENPSSYLDRFYNVVGGLPLLVSGGQAVDISRQCTDEGGGCPAVTVERARTAVGQTASGEIIVVVLPESAGVRLIESDPNKKSLSQLMLDLDAVEAINLDGGGSSQLWYDGRELIPSARRVANALVVFHNVRRHDSEIVAQSPFPIVQAGQRVTASFTLQNTGALDWRADAGYGLALVGGDSLDLPTWIPPGTSVPPFEDVTWNLDILAPTSPGVSIMRWQMAYRDPDSGEEQPFGSEVGFLVTVVPEGSSADLGEAIRQLIEQARREAEEQLAGFLERLRKDLEERLREDLEKNLPPWAVQCLLGPGVGIVTTGLAAASLRRRQRSR